MTFNIVKYLPLSFLVLGGCLVKESQWGGSTRVQWVNQSSKEICAWGYSAQNPQDIHWQELILSAQQSAAPQEISLWGKFPVYIKTCDSLRFELGLQEFNGHSLRWTLVDSSSGIQLQKAEVSSIWF